MAGGLIVGTLGLINHLVLPVPVAFILFSISLSLVCIVIHIGSLLESAVVGMCRTVLKWKPFRFYKGVLAEKNDGGLILFV